MANIYMALTTCSKSFTCIDSNSHTNLYKLDVIITP